MQSQSGLAALSFQLDKIRRLEGNVLNQLDLSICFCVEKRASTTRLAFNIQLICMVLEQWCGRTALIKAIFLQVNSTFNIISWQLHESKIRCDSKLDTVTPQTKRGGKNYSRNNNIKEHSHIRRLSVKCKIIYRTGKSRYRIVRYTICQFHYTIYNGGNKDVPLPFLFL